MAGAVTLLPGNEVFLTKMKVMEARALNFIPAFTVIDEAFMAYEDRKWSQEGPGWAPLADSTIIRKIGLSDEMMVRGEPGHTEGLKNSLTTHGEHSLFKMTPLSLTMGTNVSYAQYHQYGEGVPKRQVVDTFKSGRGLIMLRNWRMILQSYLVKGDIR